MHSGNQDSRIGDKALVEKGMALFTEMKDQLIFSEDAEILSSNIERIDYVNLTATLNQLKAYAFFESKTPEELLALAQFLDKQKNARINVLGRNGEFIPHSR